jgi:hypothetical protein
MSETPSGPIQRAELRRSAQKVLGRKRKWKKFQKGSGKGYSQLAHAIFQSPQYAKLSPRAVKLLIDLVAQYRGINNGDLTTAWSVMQKVGWRSKDLLAKASCELEQRGWILKTRQGDIHGPTLWALTFHGIDDCRDKNGRPKMDVKPDPLPRNDWRLPGYDLPPSGPKRRFQKKSPARLPGKAFPTTGKGLEKEAATVTDLTQFFPREAAQAS